MEIAQTETYNSSFERTLQLGRHNLQKKLFQEARTNFEQAAVINPKSHLPDYWLGLTYFNDGMFFGAMHHILDALEKAPEDISVRQFMVECIKQMPYFFDGLHSARLEAELLRSYDFVQIDPQDLFSIVNFITRRQKDNLSLEKQPLFPKLLEKILITDFELENQCLQIRCSLFENQIAGWPEMPKADEYKIMIAFALQAHNNEYIWSISETEQKKLDFLKRNIEIHLAKPHSDLNELGYAMVLWSMYEPLFLINGIENLNENDWQKLSGVLGELAERLYYHPKTEKELGAQLQQATAIKASSSIIVQQHYENFPYPRWLGINAQKGLSYPAWRQLHFPQLPLTELIIHAPSILVAGCGTGRHAISVAMEHPDAIVLGIDLSVTSLAYASRKMKEFNITNLNFQQGDILELKNREENFTIIESVGTLHHLKDPFAGFQCLRNLLAPGGFMKIGLYSKMAREPIESVKQEFLLSKVSHNYKDIRDIRDCLLSHHSQPDVEKILKTKDFYAFNSFQDLLLHPQEQQFTIPVIKDYLQKLGLIFLGFLLQPEIIKTFRMQYPEISSMTNLDCWHQFEQTHQDTFFGMYQFWCTDAKAGY